MFSFQIFVGSRRQSSWASCEFNTHRRRRRDSTRQLTQKIGNWVTTDDWCVHTADTTQLDFVVGKLFRLVETVANYSGEFNTHRRLNSTRQFSCVGVGGVYGALACISLCSRNNISILVWRDQCAEQIAEHVADFCHQLAGYTRHSTCVLLVG